MADTARNSSSQGNARGREFAHFEKPLNPPALNQSQRDEVRAQVQD